MERVSVVVPAYNEENTVNHIVDVLLRVPEVAQIIVVSDGSTDNTASLARSAGARVIELREKRGKGGAVSSGLDEVQNEVVLLLDADLIGLTPEHVISLVKPVLNREADMTVGLFNHGRIFTDLAHRIMPCLSGQRALRRSALLGLRLEDAGYGLEMMLTRLARESPMIVQRIPLPNLSHVTKEKKRGYWRGLAARARMYLEIVAALVYSRKSFHLRPVMSLCRRMNAIGIRRLVGYCCLFTVSLMALTAVVYSVQFRRASAQARLLDDLPLVPGQRILLVSPHPDDEILGAGGLIQKALAVGSDIRVVFMTNGDGFKRGARDGHILPVLKPQDYISYGQKRQKEALAVLNAIGVVDSQVIFLGYPDGGIAAIWRDHWDEARPFTSPTTKSSASPYQDNLYAGAPYTAPSILSSISRIIREYEPTAVFVTHPDDSHADHWATSAFVLAAVAQTSQAGGPCADLYYYAIHRGAWQIAPVISREKPLLPPTILYRWDATWYRLTLSSGQKAAKEAAVRLYKSQFKLMSGYMKNFVRPNEIFARSSAKALPVIERELDIDGDLDQWEYVMPLALDSRRGTLVRQANASAAIRRLYLVQGNNSLYIRLDAWGKIAKPAAFRVSLYVLPSENNPEVSRWVFRADPGSPSLALWEIRPEGTQKLPLKGVIKGNSLIVSVPLDLSTGGCRFMVGAESRVGSTTIDRIPWSVVSTPRILASSVFAF